jgi:hypothetical protein
LDRAGERAASANLAKALSAAASGVKVHRQPTDELLEKVNNGQDGR